LRRRVGSPRSGDRRGRPRFSWGNTWRGLFERLSDWSAHDLSKPKKINSYYQRRGTTLLRKRHLLPRNIKDLRVTTRRQLLKISQTQEVCSFTALPNKLSPSVRRPTVPLFPADVL
jgi:hypothetical protein